MCDWCIHVWCYTYVHTSVHNHDGMRRLEENAGCPARFLPYPFETVSLTELGLGWPPGSSRDSQTSASTENWSMGKQPDLALLTWRPGYFNSGVQACATASILTN